MNGNEKSAVLNIFRTVPFPYKKNIKLIFFNPLLKHESHPLSVTDE